MFYYIRQLIKKTYLVSRKIMLNSLSLAFRKKNPISMINNPKRVLIIAPPRVGDVALAFPAFYSLKTKFPNAQIHVLANQYTSDLLFFSKDISQIIVVKDSLASKIMYIFQKKTKYDFAFDLNSDYSLWPALIAGLTGNYSIGYDIYGRGFLFDIKLSKPDNLSHASNVFFGPIKQFPDIKEIGFPHIEVPVEISAELNNVLSDIQISKNDKLVLIHPGAHHPTQKWLPEYFAETADKIIEQQNKKVVFIGGPHEKEYIEQVISQMKSAPNGFFTNLDVKTLVGLINRADLMICNNSGPLHIAVAVNTPTVSTMGPTVMERWKPLGAIHRILRIDTLPCIGCNLGYCKIKTHDCMRLIRPSMVLEAVEACLRYSGVDNRKII
jgi:lipopolysaccharide heptosyltransferase II